jgi:hypothetical protein
MVVRLTDGRETVRAYVSEQADYGAEHVTGLISGDADALNALIDDLTDEEGTTQPSPGEWSVAEVLQHLLATLPRSKARLTALSRGQQFTNPPVAGGSGVGNEDTRSFSELKRDYEAGVQDVLSIMQQAGTQADREVTAEHAEFGPFNWLEWAVYSHHVHVHDHLGQIEEIRATLRP